MKSYRRKLADHLERLLKVRIARTDQVGRLYEQEQMRRLFEAFDIDCVFDVGANEGQFYRLVRQRVGFRGPVLSYEPLPVLASRLAAEAGQGGDWHIRNVALDAEPGERLFHVAHDSQFSSLRCASADGLRRFADEAREVETIRVETATLASELAEWRPRLGFTRPYLKLDTQGHDLAVAAGAAGELTTFVAIQTEAALVSLYEGAPDLTSALDFFQARGFAPNAIVPNNEGHFPWLLEVDILFVNRRYADAVPTNAFRRVA